MKSLSAGDKLGPYEIRERIGKGGMGEVYRALDPRMNRSVAIKVSAEAFSDRFSREVRAVASLSHPNVCTVHDVGPDYLVLELVEGPTLAERIREGAIPLDEALRIAHQIADALEAAHERGVVHRDLKPANIKLTPDGVVKVLDFGLAKLDSSPATTSDESPTLSASPTLAGVILGTAAYMSPEQARGKVVDKRSDIFSFGVVLHEMVTGRRLFQGEDLTDTVASVVKAEPDLSGAPPELRRLLKKCLEKNPKKRLRDIGDVWELLQPETVAAVAPVRTGRARLAWLAVTVSVLALIALAWVHFRELPAALQGVTFSMEPPPQTRFAGALAPSPDGRYVAFAAGPEDSGAGPPSLWLRPLDSLTARPLPGTQGAFTPFWSPDSKAVAFFAGDKLKRIEIAGGNPRILTDAPSSAGSWGRNDVILFGSADGLRRVPASGGSATLVIGATGGESQYAFPQFLPDGNRFLYFAYFQDVRTRGVYASSLDHPQERQAIMLTTNNATYVPPRATYPAYLLSIEGPRLQARRFNADSLRQEGDPVSVAEDVAAFGVSGAGLLTYSTGVPRYLLQKRPTVWFDRNGKQIGDAVLDDRTDAIALAPDAKRLAIALAKNESGSTQPTLDIWVRELARGVTTRLTFSPGTNVMPQWSPDGKWVAFTSAREKFLQIYRKEASGAGPEERLTTGDWSKVLLQWSDDGKYLLYQESKTQTQSDLMALPLQGDKKPIAVVQTQFRNDHGAISPDGRWIAYTSNDSGRDELYVQAFPGASGAPAGRLQVSNGGAGEIRWRGDGREIFYQSLDKKVMASSIQVDAQGIRADTPRVLFSAEFGVGFYHEFEVTRDGQRFLLTLAPRLDTQNMRVVISNWQEILRR